MTDMIERVARALCSYSEFMWQDNIPKAKAAIEAMREPTDVMLDRITDLEERNIGYKQDIVLLTQENSQMFERITALEEQHTRLHARFVHHKEDHFKEPAEPDRCIVCDCILTSYEGDVCRSHEPAEPDKDDLVERLRDNPSYIHPETHRKHIKERKEAADRIEQLEEAIENHLPVEYNFHGTPTEDWTEFFDAIMGGKQ